VPLTPPVSSEDLELAAIVARKPGNSLGASDKKKGRTVNWTAADWLSYYRMCGQAITMKRLSTTDDDLAREFGLTSKSFVKKRGKQRGCIRLPRPGRVCWKVQKRIRAQLFGR